MKKNIILSIVSLAVILSLLEVALRIAEPKSPPGTTYGVVVHKNSDGFRDEEYAIPKPKGTCRILVLGDSFTWGVGLETGETLPKILQSALSKKYPDLRLEVINAAAPGLDSEEEFAVLQKKGIRYQPDVVLLVYNINDVEFTPHRFALQEQNPLQPGGPDSGNAGIYSHKTGIRGVIYWFESRSKLAAFVVPRVGHLLRKYNLIQSVEFSWVEKVFRAYEDDSRGWHKCRVAIAGMQDLCRENNATLVATIYPLFSELDHYGGMRAHAIVAEFFQQRGIPYVDILPVFLGKNATSFWINFADDHPNAEAHHLAADAILPTLEEAINNLAR